MAWPHARLRSEFFEPIFIEKLLDLAALHKLNVFHWHLTDDQAWRLEIPSKPELTERAPLGRICAIE